MDEECSERAGAQVAQETVLDGIWEAMRTEEQGPESSAQERTRDMEGRMATRTLPFLESSLLAGGHAIEAHAEEEPRSGPHRAEEYKSSVYVLPKTSTQVWF